MMKTSLLTIGLLALLVPGRADPAEDIVDTAITGHFGIFVTALKAADLVDTLKGTGPFTMFAPTDAAFNRLPAGVLERLLKPENRETLERMLKYHVVTGTVMAADIVTLHEARTTEGRSLTIKTVNGAVTINGAKVTKTDIVASNGVIHEIDTVLLPEAAPKMTR